MAYKRFIIDQNLKAWLTLKDCHALEKFQIEMGVEGSIFEPHPRNFGERDIFWRSTNDITIIFGNFHYNKSYQKCTKAIRPGVEESLGKGFNMRNEKFPNSCSLQNTSKDSLTKRIEELCYKSVFPNQKFPSYNASNTKGE